ncbi:MAG: metal-sensitive transcriptional regulator [Dehalococcoidales bacterium]|nr:metal-sensitive transcriptional regulator [Dehalococcoidales bacterium]
MENVQTDKRKQEILRRLKSVEGHIRGIQRMVEENQYCIDVINQSAAVQAALAKVDSLILERHLQTCVTTAIRSEDRAERERVIGELLQVFQGGNGNGRGRRPPRGELDLTAEPEGSGCHLHGS